MHKTFSSIFLSFILCFSLQAGGYQVSLHSHRNMGMGLIGTSLNFDASSVFYNPGAISTLPGKFSFAGGTSFIRSTTVFELGPDSHYQSVTDNPLSTPFYFYGAYKINDQLAVGLAVNTPYGSSLEWEEGWAGRFLIKDISLRNFTFQPTLSYRINENISAGAGLVYATGNFDLSRNLPVQGEQSEGEIRLGGETDSWGYNAGVLISLNNTVNIGISYRSRIDMEIDEGYVDISVPETLNSLFPGSTNLSTSLPLPANLDFGLSYQQEGIFMAGISINYVFWDAYETLNFDFSENTTSLTDSNNPREYSNTLIIRAGGEYYLSDNFMIRAGAYYDPSPVSKTYFSPETPGLNSTGLTTGLSFFPLEGLMIDAGFIYLMGEQTAAAYAPANFEGKYKSNAYITGLGITYQF